MPLKLSKTALKKSLKKIPKMVLTIHKQKNWELKEINVYVSIVYVTPTDQLVVTGLSPGLIQQPLNYK